MRTEWRAKKKMDGWMGKGNIKGKKEGGEGKHVRSQGEKEDVLRNILGIGYRQS